MSRRDRVPLDFDGSLDGEPVVTPPTAIRERQDKRHMPGPDAPDELETVDARSPERRPELEQRAVNLLVKQLKRKGKSDRFIEEHMDEIQEAARRELYQD